MCNAESSSESESNAESSGTSVDQYDDEVIWDYAPFNVCIGVTDSDGQDLLDESYEGNILGSDISITYLGDTYYLGYGSASYVKTRDTWAEFSGLTYDNTSYNWNLLVFGEFDTTNGSYDMDLSLNLGDDNEYALRYVRDFDFTDNYATIELYIDGEPIDGTVFTVVM